MRRVIVVAANPCFDRICWVDELVPGTVNRSHRVATVAGGKGVNVVRALKDAGTPATLVSLLPRGGAGRWWDLLRDDELDVLAVETSGEIRGATIVVEDGGRATVLNEPGPQLDRTDRDRLVTAVQQRLAAGCRAVACSGSLPPGLPTDTYAAVVTAAGEAGVPVVVDTAREALAAALAAEPDLVTPNLAEAESLGTGRVLEPATRGRDVPERACVAADRLLQWGAQRALVTAGEHGAAFAGPAGSHWLPAPRVEVVNPIGAGDALVAGVLAALHHGADWSAAAEQGVALASASVAHPMPGRIR